MSVDTEREKAMELADSWDYWMKLAMKVRLASELELGLGLGLDLDLDHPKQPTNSLQAVQ